MKTKRILNFYKLLISPALHFMAGPNGGCRFHPTCSAYADEAITEYGIFKGTWMTFLRILRCQPFSGRSGYDPVPHKENAKCCG